MTDSRRASVARLRQVAPDVLLFGSVPLGLLSTTDVGSGWARPVALVVFLVGAVWLTSRTIRVRVERRRSEGVDR